MLLAYFSGIFIDVKQLFIDICKLIHLKSAKGSVRFLHYF
jgi:hypothetical protein